MKNLAEQVEIVISGLDESQNTAEEIAFELLNAVDNIKKYNEEMNQIINLIFETDSGEEAEEAVLELKEAAVKASEAMERLMVFSHKIEEVTSEQRRYVEEAKQVVDFLSCSLN